MSLPFSLNPRVGSIVPYEPGKPAEELARELDLPRTVKLASNENPHGPSLLAVRAMQQSAAGCHRYPDGGAFYLRRRLARHVDLPEDHIILGNGSTEIVEMLTKAFLPPDGESLVAQGAFIMYKIASLAASATAREVPMTPDLRHDLVALRSAISPTTRLVFIANPNNPTGTWVTRGELDAYLQDVPDSVITVMDEAYREYLDDAEYPDGVEAVRQGRRVVVLRTFSKIHGLAGARIGYGLAHPDIVRAVEKVRSPFNTTSIGQAGAVAALDDQDHVVRCRLDNREQRSRLQAAFRERGLAFVPSAGNFVLAALGLPGREIFQAFLQQGVILRPVDGYGFPDHVRISVGTEEENTLLLQALDRVREKLA